MLLPWLGSGNQRNFWLWDIAHLNFKIPTRTRLDLATSKSICDPPRLLEMKIISPIKAGWKYSLWVFPVYIREPYQSKNSSPAATAHLALLQLFWQTLWCKSIVSKTFSRKECHLMFLEFTSTRTNSFSGFPHNAVPYHFEARVYGTLL